MLSAKSNKQLLIFISNLLIAEQLLPKPLNVLGRTSIVKLQEEILRLASGIDYINFNFYCGKLELKIIMIRRQRYRVTER